MSAKPVCVPCRRFYRPARNGTMLLENVPNGTWTGDGPTPPGPSASQWWKPYKLWQGDLWRCPDCAHEILVGTGFRPIAERHDSFFEETIADSLDGLIINDY